MTIYYTIDLVREKKNLCKLIKPLILQILTLLLKCFQVQDFYYLICLLDFKKGKFIKLSASTIESGNCFNNTGRE